MKAHLMHEKRLNKIIKYCQKRTGEQKKSELDETVDWMKGEWTSNRQGRSILKTFLEKGNRVENRRATGKEYYPTTIFKEDK